MIKKASLQRLADAPFYFVIKQVAKKMEESDGPVLNKSLTAKSCKAQIFCKQFWLAEGLQKKHSLTAQPIRKLSDSC